MSAHTRKTLEAIQGTPAPRDLEWDAFIALWKDIADDVKEESGDRLSVAMHGHREVFRRPHDGRVSIEDVERARHLLAAKPDLKGSGDVVAIAIDDRKARILDFDLDAVKVQDTEHDVRNKDSRGHHMRTVERDTGRDDQADLKGFFDDVAKELQNVEPDKRFVVLGHGDGKSDAAALFVERLKHSHGELAERVAGVARVDLSAANDADLEKAAADALRQP